MLTRTVTITVLLLAFLFLAACSPPISGDAGTDRPTPNVWGETYTVELEQLERAKEAR